MKIKECTWTLKGHGETKEAALNKVFSQIQGKVRANMKGIAIRIEPKDITFTSAIVTRYTERFLGFLFPRERIRYEIEASVTVQVSLVDVDEIQFVEQKEQLGTLQRIMQLR